MAPPDTDFDFGDDFHSWSMQPVIYLDQHGQRRIEMMYRGFDLPDRRLFNARSEGIVHASFAHKRPPRTTNALARWDSSPIRE